jgi:hypothetical protein
VSDELDKVFPPGDEHKVTTASGQVALVVSTAPRLVDGRVVGETVPAAIALRCQGAAGILRIAGTTVLASSEDQIALLRYGRAMFEGGRLRKVVVMSGGTRILDESDGRVVMSILELPMLIREQWGNPTVRTLGSMPRTTATMSYRGRHSTFVPSDKIETNTLAHPGLDVFWVVQVDASQIAGWNGDLLAYFALMDLLRAEGAATGLLVLGGGAVTAQEIRMSQEHGHPVGVSQGLGQFADDLINWDEGRFGQVTPKGRAIIEGWQRGGYDWSNYTVLETPEAGQAWLTMLGLMTP